MQNKLVSIVIPSFNHESYIYKCIDSFINNNYVNCELIIIDDGSKDNSAKIILSLKEVCLKRFTRFLFIKKKNKGVSSALNLGISKAKGNYIFLCASDDYINQNAITTMVDFFNKRKDVGLVFSSNRFVDSNNNKIFVTHNNKKYHSTFKLYTCERNLKIKKSKVLDYSFFLEGNCIASGVMIKREVFSEVGYFDTKSIIEDWPMWLKITKKYNTLYIPRNLTNYRIHELNTHKKFLNDINYINTISDIISNEFCYAIKCEKLLKIWFTSKVKSEKLKDDYYLSQTLEKNHLLSELAIANEKLSTIYRNPIFKILNLIRKLFIRV